MEKKIAWYDMKGHAHTMEGICDPYLHNIVGVLKRGGEINSLNTPTMISNVKREYENRFEQKLFEQKVGK